VALVEARFSSTDAPVFAISLARTLLVSWPVGGAFVGRNANGDIAWVHHAA
jgi:hypothetical protein